jgi:hypothetical protein
MQPADSREARPRGEAADKSPGDDREKPGREDARTSDPREPRGVEKEIAEADKKARTGSKSEPLRNTPPAGAWNDTSSD